MLSEKEKQDWMDKMLATADDDDEEKFLDEIDNLPPEKGEEVSDFLFRLWWTGPPPDIKK